MPRVLSVGWKLSNGFAHQPLLDLLRSPFVRFTDHERQRETAARFEHGGFSASRLPAGCGAVKTSQNSTRLTTIAGRHRLGIYRGSVGVVAPLQRLLNEAAAGAPRSDCIQSLMPWA